MGYGRLEYFLTLILIPKHIDHSSSKPKPQETCFAGSARDPEALGHNKVIDCPKT
jgi:hypothetical protein